MCSDIQTEHECREILYELSSVCLAEVEAAPPSATNGNGAAVFLTSVPGGASPSNSRTQSGRASDHALTAADFRKCIDLLAREGFVEAQVAKVEAAVKAKQEKQAAAMVCMCALCTVLACGAEWQWGLRRTWFRASSCSLDFVMVLLAAVGAFGWSRRQTC